MVKVCLIIEWCSFSWVSEYQTLSPDFWDFFILRVSKKDFLVQMVRAFKGQNCKKSGIQMFLDFLCSVFRSSLFLSTFSTKQKILLLLNLLKVLLTPVNVEKLPRRLRFIKNVCQPSWWELTQKIAVLCLCSRVVFLIIPKK